MKETISPGIAETAIAWQTILDKSVDMPIYGMQILKRLKRAANNGYPLTLFVPWGVRPEGSFGTPEKQAMDELSQFSKSLVDAGVPNRILLMPADLYAKDINSMNPVNVDSYFSAVTREAKNRKFFVKPWSEIKKENIGLYESTKKWRANAEMLWKNMPKDIWYRDILPAALRRNPSPTIEGKKASAFAYLQERICEAVIVEKLYRPVKVSMVSPNRDAFVDAELPRMYLLPRDKRYPWLKGGAYDEE